jgi:small GTP-binding protein
VNKVGESLQIFKVMIIGDTGVGKTTAVNRFVDGHFVSNTEKTLGVDFYLKYIDLDLFSETTAALQIWDVAGESKFRSILPYYIPGTKGLILAFDGTKSSTLNRLNEWLEIFNLFLSGIPTVLISTKNDLEQNFDMNEVNQFMKNHNIEEYYSTSSLSGENISEAFKSLTIMIAKRKSVIEQN